MAANSRPSVERAGDREKALETALVQIERQFGKGSVMRLGQEAHVPVEVIPTGSISLDVALGLGGLPRGRIVEIYGPESSGKCLTADTYVWTSRGLETIAEVFADAGMTASCTSRVTDVSEARHPHGQRARRSGRCGRADAQQPEACSPAPATVRPHGQRTHNHPLRVISERGFIVWREAGEIQAGDTLVSALFGAIEAAEGDGLSEDEAVLLGYLVAEGTLSYQLLRPVHQLGSRGEWRVHPDHGRDVRGPGTQLRRERVRGPGKGIREQSCPSSTAWTTSRLRARRFPPASVPRGIRRNGPSCRRSSRATGGSIRLRPSDWGPRRRSLPATCSSCFTAWEFRRPSLQATTPTMSGTTGR